MPQSINKRMALIVPLLTALFAIFLLGAALTNAAPLLAWTGIQATGVVSEQSDFVSGSYRGISSYTVLSELTLTENNEVPAPIIEQVKMLAVPITYYLYLPIIMVPPGPGDCLTAEESQLVNLINQYRNVNGLTSVPGSKSLTQVAQWHVIDLHENNPDSGSDHGLPCNTHSWSNQGFWSPVCYTSDHAYASGMWNKPREITSNAYMGNGFENASSSSGQATASGAFNSWKNSPAHNAVILEQGIWSGYNWPAMGVGIYQHHAVLWFGDQADLQGPVTKICNVYN